MYSGAASCTSRCTPTPAAIWKLYSIRSGFHARGPGGGSLYRAPYHVAQVRRARRTTGLAFAGSPGTGPAPASLTAACSASASTARRASSSSWARPTGSMPSSGASASGYAARSAATTVGGAPAACSSRESWSEASAAMRAAAGPSRTGSRSTAVSSGSPASSRMITGPTGPGPMRTRVTGACSTVASTRIGLAASSPVSSPTCHCRPSSHSGSAIRASWPSVRPVPTVVASSRCQVMTPPASCRGAGRRPGGTGRARPASRGPPGACGPGRRSA